MGIEFDNSEIKEPPQPLTRKVFPNFENIKQLQVKFESGSTVDVGKLTREHYTSISDFEGSKSSKSSSKSEKSSKKSKRKAKKNRHKEKSRPEEKPCLELKKQVCFAHRYQPSIPRSTNEVDPYERYLNLTSEHRDRFTKIMEDMRTKTETQYRRIQEKTRQYEEKDQNLNFFKFQEKNLLEIRETKSDFLDTTINVFEDLEIKKISERIKNKSKPNTNFFQICFI